MGVLGTFLKRRRRDGAVSDRERGRANERHVCLVLQRKSRPWWIKNVRMSTSDEDRLGIDVVVETFDMGDIFLQVKSSLRRAAEFKEKPRRIDVEVVVVGRSDDANSLYGKALGALILLRERSEEKRARLDASDGT